MKRISILLLILGSIIAWYFHMAGVQRSARKAANTPPTTCAEKLKIALTRCNENTQAPAVEAMQTPECIDFALATLKGADAQVKEAAIVAVSNVMDNHPDWGFGERAIDPLIERLDDPNPYVRSVAIASLEHAFKRGVPARQAIAPLYARLKSGTTDKGYLMAALGAAKDPRVLDMLLAAMDSKDIDLRHHAVDVLPGYDDPRVLKLFARLKDDPDKWVHSVVNNHLDALARKADAAAARELAAARQKQQAEQAAKLKQQRELTIFTVDDSAKPTLMADTKIALAKKDPRRNIRITLTPDKPEYFLGESVLLHYKITNAGKDTLYVNSWEHKSEPFFISMGGDTRNNIGRALRFKVEAMDQDGRKTEDPYPNPMSFGGMMGLQTLKPGDSLCEDLDLMLYRNPDKAGTYTIKVYHDLGWEDRNAGMINKTDSDISTGTHNAPTLTASIRLRMPDEQQAQRIFNSAMNAPKDFGRTWGECRHVLPAFYTMRYPVYLPMMRELAAKGDERAFAALGEMAFPEATMALLDLANSKETKVSTKAEALLLQRVPSMFYRDRPSPANYLAAHALRPDLKAKIIQLGWRALAVDGREDQMRGARMIQSLGDKEDLPQLIGVMDRLLPQYQYNGIEQRAWLRPATVSQSLSSTAEELIKRGATPPATAATPGQAVAFLAGLKADKNFRPSGWQNTVTPLLRHRIPFIRALAMESIPVPLNATSIEFVAAGIKDGYQPVQGAACNLAAKAKLPRFSQPLQELLRTTSNEWLLNSAFDAAATCGANMDTLLGMLVDRLDPVNKEWNMRVLQLLVHGTVSTGSYGFRNDIDWQHALPTMRRAWLDFIKENRGELLKRKRFTPGGPELKPEMFPPEFKFSRPGKPDWP